MPSIAPASRAATASRAADAACKADAHCHAIGGVAATPGPTDRLPSSHGRWAACASMYSCACVCVRGLVKSKEGAGAYAGA